MTYIVGNQIAMPQAAIFIWPLITNRSDGGLIEKPKLVNSVVSDRCFNIYRVFHDFRA